MISSDTLRRAAELLEGRWTRGTFFDLSNGLVEMCALGAILRASGQIEPGAMTRWNGNRYIKSSVCVSADRVHEIDLATMPYLLDPCTDSGRPITTLAAYNDDENTSAADMQTFLLLIAEALDDDATRAHVSEQIRALADAANADEEVPCSVNP